jgi:hypothetical protein
MRYRRLKPEVNFGRRPRGAGHGSESSAGVGARQAASLAQPAILHQALQTAPTKPSFSSRKNSLNVTGTKPVPGLFPPLTAAQGGLRTPPE